MHCEIFNPGVKRISFGDYFATNLAQKFVFVIFFKESPGTLILTTPFEQLGPDVYLKITKNESCICVIFDFCIFSMLHSMKMIYF